MVYWPFNLPKLLIRRAGKIVAKLRCQIAAKLKCQRRISPNV